ncbi:Hypothetical protein NTJ_06968 [Nesidiocoris tenuis]|uniref:Uncharacterized protein n=1 Tax=Nesidiocoris tenuis TaxID=355587 RepID=A0ABN7ARS2_9HEMI|nr:Hypothetical protein NTJ_06968 [Nesidiocoris tenuis]
MEDLWSCLAQEDDRVPCSVFTLHITRRDTNGTIRFHFLPPPLPPPPSLDQVHIKSYVSGLESVSATNHSDYLVTGSSIFFLPVGI